MSSLTAPEKAYFIKALGMEGGYVLDFTNDTFDEFFQDYNVDIYSERFRIYGDSKAKKLRAFWHLESDEVVGDVLAAMLNLHEANEELNDRTPNEKVIQRCREAIAKLRNDTRYQSSSNSSESTASAFLNQQPDTPAFNKLPVESVVQNTFTTNIYGNQNVVAAGVNVHQEITPVKQGDIQSLLSSLRELNLADEDLCELQTAVTSDPTAEKDSFGSKVSAWIGKMASKAATGTFKFGADQTTTAILQALNGYYGN